MISVYLDTMIYEYAFDRHSPFCDAAIGVMSAAFRRPNRVISSFFVRAELLVIPARRQDAFSTARVNRLLSQTVETSPLLTNEMLFTFTNLRAHHGVRAMDALHLASAAGFGVDSFVTNDKKLLNLQVAGIGAVVALEDAANALSPLS